MTLSDLSAEHIGHLVTVQAVRETTATHQESVRLVGILESAYLHWADDVLVSVELRVSGTVHALTLVRNGTLEDYTVEVVDR